MKCPKTDHIVSPPSALRSIQYRPIRRVHTKRHAQCDHFGRKYKAYFTSENFILIIGQILNI